MKQLLIPMPLLDEIISTVDGIHCEKGEIKTTTTTANCNAGRDG